MRDRADAGGTARSSQRDSTSNPLNSRRVHPHILRRRYPAVVERHRRAANDDPRAGFPAAKGVLYCWIDSRGGDSKSQTHQGAASPALHDYLAILIGCGIVCKRGPREFPYQCDVRRHSVEIARQYRAQNSRTDAGTLCHRGAQLRARAAVLVTHGSKAGRAPCLDGEVTPEPPKGGYTGKQPCCPRTRVDDVAHIAGVVVPVPFELPNRFTQCPSDHVVLLLSLTVRRNRPSECDIDCNVITIVVTYACSYKFKDGDFTLSRFAALIRHQD